MQLFSFGKDVCDYSQSSKRLSRFYICIGCCQKIIQIYSKDVDYQPVELLLEPCFIEVGATVTQVADATVGVELRQLVEVDIGNENHLRVGSCLGTASVVRELEVAWREHSRLSVLDVHVLNLRQVADTARNGNVTFVFDGPCLGADTHAVVCVLCICIERDEQYLHSLVCHKTRQFREFYVIAYQNANASAVGVECLDLRTLAETPELLLIRCDVNLLIHFD